MSFLVTGATGFVGRQITAVLDAPVALSRDPERARTELGERVVIHAWAPAAGPPPPQAFAGVEAVVHLAGENVADGRWSAAKKARLRDSRVVGTRHLVQALQELALRPRVLVAASAIAFYGDRGDTVLDETAAPGSDFLADLCREWEAESLRARDFGIRVAVLRVGVVLGRGGGALEKMLPAFKRGMGGRFGSGEQWVSWIHIDDLVGLVLHAAQCERVSGPVNAVSPHPVTNRELTRLLAAAVGKPAFLPVPRIALRLAFGELGDFLLASQRVVPRVAEATGYTFRFASLEKAFESLID
ncbi:MAG: TIGR01777 family oxidoreductase [Planctomycetota bacterium]